MKHIVTLTMNPTIDMSALIDQVIANKKMRCTDPRRDPGGGGINVSRAIQRLGGASLALYPKGGPHGDMLKNLLDEEEIEQQPVEIQNDTRENYIFSEESTERQFRFGLPGPSLSEEEQTRCLDALSEIDPPPDYLVASGSLPPDVSPEYYKRVAEIAHERDARFILDTSGEALKHATREGVFLLKPNMRELQNLVGRDIESEEEQEDAAHELIKKEMCEVLILSLGAGGALQVTEDTVRRLRAPSVPIKSRVGAGDSMVAGMVLSLARGETLDEAVMFGIAAGTAAVMTPGTELCRKEDADRLYRAMREENGQKKTMSG